MRNRIEDLGRIYEILDEALQSSVFDPPREGVLSDEVCEIKCLLAKCWEIASGQDILNDFGEFGSDECRRCKG